MCTTSGLLVVIIILVIFLLFAKLRAAKKPCRKYCTKVQKACNTACQDEGFSIIPSPSVEGYTADQELIGEDHSDAIKKMGLESDVVSSHERYVRDLDHKTTTASKQTVLDSFNPPVPWHGLPRKAMFARLGADSGARTVQSETPEQTLAFALHNGNTYCL